MAAYVYLSVIPEALIVSMLPPEAFGSYFAVGTFQRSRGQAMFFEVDPDFASPHFALEAARQRCVPHPDGTPKHSVYVSIYRTLEHVPLDALRSLYLATDDGRVLALAPQPHAPAGGDALHLYQEFCPVTPRVASTLEPAAFARYITTPNALVTLPRLMFCELELGALADDPVSGEAGDLPYPHIEHLRDCLCMLREGTGKPAKIVMRAADSGFLYRSVSTGFYVGDADGLLFYPMPSRAALEDEHRIWWRSALMRATR